MLQSLEASMELREEDIFISPLLTPFIFQQNFMELNNLFFLNVHLI